GPSRAFNHGRMSSPKPSAAAPAPPPPPVKLDVVAAFLSYLIPGLGQLTQGRIGKGLLYLVSLYALFFYGMCLGSFKNVYLPDYHANEPTVNRLASDIYTRFQFVGQFPIGMTAWPAIYQYVVYTPDDKNPPLWGFMRAPDMGEINRLQRDGD